MTNKFGVAGFLLGIIALVVGGIAVFQPNQIVTVQPTQPLGGGSSQYHTNLEYFVGGISFGGGVITAEYATSSVVDTGALTASSVAGTAATSSFSLILRPTGVLNLLPEVGMSCAVTKNDAASSTKLEAWNMKVTAVDSTSGLKNASATLTYFNYGAMTDYGLANVFYRCTDQN